MLDSIFTFSRYSFIPAASIPLFASSIASRTDCLCVTEIRWLSTTWTFPPKSSESINAVWHELDSPLDIGIYTTCSACFNSSSHISVTEPGSGCEVEISTSSESFLKKSSCDKLSL